LNKAGVALLVLGLLQMTGDVLRIPALKAVGAATVASPAPRVFSSVRGLETFSTRFFIEWTDHERAEHSLEVTPEVNSRLTGPYNRRNVFGAVLSYGPVMLSDPHVGPMFEAAARYALCGNAPLLRELGVPQRDVAGSVRIRFEPRPGTAESGLPRVIEAPCK